MNKRMTQILVASFLAISIITPMALASGARDQVSGSFDLTSEAVFSNTPSDVSGSMSGSAFIGFGMPSGTKLARTMSHSTVWVDVSGYNSEVGQTDDSPFIGACNLHVHDGTIAANVIDANGRNLPCGTLVKIPSLYGDKIFVVEDRLNKRYTKNVDVWFELKSDALKLGRRHVAIEVLN